MEDILDHVAESPAPAKVQNKKFLIWILGLVMLNILLFSVIPVDSRSVRERFAIALPGIPLIAIITGFPLGVLVALVPYRKLPYHKRYLRSALLAMLVLQIVMLILNLMNAYFYF